jgi:hypothetical protein
MTAYWVTRDRDFVFTADDHNAMPYTTGCRKITKQKYMELAARPRAKSSVTTRKTRKKKEKATKH